MKASVFSPANIAIIKHWGLNYTPTGVLPLAGSVSFNLSQCMTHTTIKWQNGAADEIYLDGVFLDADYPRASSAYAIISAARNYLGLTGKVAHVQTKNSFPTGAGIASSASGFSALSAACLSAGGLDITTKKGFQSVVEICAVGGSISALRSLVDGWGQVEYNTAEHRYVVMKLKEANHWDIVDLVVVLQNVPKVHGSADGHKIAHTSLHQLKRIEQVEKHLGNFHDILSKKDFSALASMAQAEANMMLQVMKTTTPALDYTLPESHTVIQKIEQMQNRGLDVFWTIDAGANPHIITTEAESVRLQAELESLPWVKYVLRNVPCRGTHTTDNHLF